MIFIFKVSGFIQESQSTESPIEIHNEDEDECERQDFANDDGGNPDEIVANVKTGKICNKVALDRFM